MLTKTPVRGILLSLSILGISFAQELPIIESDQVQPVTLTASRFIEALGYFGGPLPEEVARQFAEAKSKPLTEKVAAIQAALDPLCLAMITINPESRVSVVTGPASPRLVVGEWMIFPVKVHNEAGVTAPLNVNSKQAIVGNAQPSESRWMQLLSLIHI